MLRLSLVVPIYGDAELAEPFCAEFSRVMTSYFKGAPLQEVAEVLFIHDGSGSAQFKILQDLTGKYPFAAVVDLSRNFGQHIALSCGYSLARGEYVAIADVDQQDPLQELPKLFDEIRAQGVDVMTGLRKARKDSFLKTTSAKLFHKILNALTGYQIPLNCSTMRIMSRKFINAYNRLSEKSRYIPGLEMWLGFNRAYLAIEHRPRSMGKSSYNIRKRLILAMDSVISFSDVPLRICVVVGASIAGVGFVATFILIFLRLFTTEFLPGYVSLVSLLVFIGGVQILFVGLLSLYVGRILKEVQNRPLFLIRETVNLAA